MRRLAALGLAALGLGGCAVASTAFDAGQERAAGGERPALRAVDGRRSPRSPRARPARAPRMVATRHLGAALRRRTVLRAAPGGRAVVEIGRRSRFGGPTVLAVVARRGRWLGVLHPWMPNGKAGWVRAEAARLVHEPWEITIDRSDRQATVLRRGRVIRRLRVGVGRPATPTPVGRFAVTDLLRSDGSPPYGCCILALTARQPNLPQGWPGGDRVALHGRPGADIRTATSTGCLVVGDRDIRWLIDRVPVGTRVDIRR